MAGDVTPIFSITQYGIADLASGVNPLSIPLTCSALSVTIGGNNGGYLISLTGTGFPLDKSLMSISVCGNQATINTINNINVDFYVPACSLLGNQSVTVTIGSSSCSSLSFDFNDGSATAPIITMLSPTSANHAVKGTLNISGSNFGSDSSVVKVHLANATGKIYELPILSITDTLLKVGLPGGLEGDYKVVVNVQPDKGDSIAGGVNADAFSYKFTVSSVSPSTGSYHGNTLLTITG